MDTLKSLGEISMGSRLKRLSDYLMKETQSLYKQQGIDFDPFLFPAFYSIAASKKTTNTALYESLKTSQPAVTQTINKLQDRGLINLDSHPQDKRKKLISLSEKGTRLFYQLQPLWKIIDEVVKLYSTSSATTLIGHITHFEDALKKGLVMKTINARIQNELAIKVSPYQEVHKKFFYDLNIEWLETYFYVEDFDREVLSNPETYILNLGGHIFFALEGKQVVGTVALMYKEPGEFELTKMAVSPEHRGKKIGQKLMQHCIDFGTENNFKKLFLYSNTLLENAIYIYRKYGFQEIPVEPDSPYERSNIKMELPLS